MGATSTGAQNPPAPADAPAPKPGTFEAAPLPPEAEVCVTTIHARVPPPPTSADLTHWPSPHTGQRRRVGFRRGGRVSISSLTPEPGPRPIWLTCLGIQR